MTDNSENAALSVIQNAQCINAMNRMLCNNSGIPFVNPMAVINQLQELSGAVQQPQASLSATNNFTRVHAKQLDAQGNQVNFLPFNFKAGHFPTPNKTSCKEERLREQDGVFAQEWNSSSVSNASESELSDASKNTPTDSMIFDGRLITNVPDNILDCPFLTEEDKLKIRKGLAERRCNARDIIQESIVNDLNRTKIPSLLDLEVAPPGLTLIRNDNVNSYDSTNINFNETTLHDRQLIDYHIGDVTENVQNINRTDNRHIEWQPGGWRKILSLDVPLSAFNKQQNVKIPPPNVVHRMPVKMNYAHLGANSGHSNNEFLQANLLNNINALHAPINAIGQPMADVSGLSLIDRQRLINALNMAPLTFQQQTNNLISIPPQAQLLNILQPPSPRQIKSLKRKHRYSLAPSPYRTRSHCSSPSVFSSRKRYRDLDAPTLNDEIGDDRRIVSYADFDATDDKEIEDEKKKQDMDFETSLMAELDRIKKRTINDNHSSTLKTPTVPGYGESGRDSDSNKYHDRPSWRTYSTHGLNQFDTVENEGAAEVNFRVNCTDELATTFNENYTGNEAETSVNGDAPTMKRTLTNVSDVGSLITSVDSGKMSYDYAVANKKDHQAMNGKCSLGNVDFKHFGLDKIPFVNMNVLSKSDRNTDVISKFEGANSSIANVEKSVDGIGGLKLHLFPHAVDGREMRASKIESFHMVNDEAHDPNSGLMKQQGSAHAEDENIKPLSAEMILEYLTRPNKLPNNEEDKNTRSTCKPDNRKFQGIHDEKELKIIHKILATEHNVLIRRPHRLFEYDVNKEFETHLQEEYRQCSLPVVKPLCNFTSTLNVVNELVSYYLSDQDENVKVVFNSVLLKKCLLFNNEKASKLLKKPWINMEIKNLILRHKELHNRTESGEMSLRELNEYKRIRGRIKELIKLAKAQYARKMKEREEGLQNFPLAKGSLMQSGGIPMSTYPNSFEYGMVNNKLNENAVMKNLMPSTLLNSNNGSSNVNMMAETRMSNYMMNEALSGSVTSPATFSSLMSRFSMNKIPLQLLQQVDAAKISDVQMGTNANQVNVSATKLMPNIIPFDFRNIPPPNYHPFTSQKFASGSQPLIVPLENGERMSETRTSESPATTVPSSFYAHIPPPPIPLFNRPPADVRSYFNPEVPPPTNFTVPPPDINKILNSDIGNVLRSLSNAKKELSSTLKRPTIAADTKPITSLPPPSFFANLPPPRLGTFPVFLSGRMPNMSPLSSSRCSVPNAFTQPADAVVVRSNNNETNSSFVSEIPPRKQRKLSLKTDEDILNSTTPQLSRTLLAENAENNCTTRYANKWRKHSDVTMEEIIKDAKEFVMARVKAAKAEAAAKVAKSEGGGCGGADVDDNDDVVDIAIKNSVSKAFPIKIELECNKSMTNNSDNTIASACTESETVENQFVDNKCSSRLPPVSLQVQQHCDKTTANASHLDEQTFVNDDTLRNRIFL